MYAFINLKIYIYSLLLTQVSEAILMLLQNIQIQIQIKNSRNFASRNFIHYVLKFNIYRKNIDFDVLYFFKFKLQINYEFLLKTTTNSVSLFCIKYYTELELARYAIGSENFITNEKVNSKPFHHTKMIENEVKNS